MKNSFNHITHNKVILALLITKLIINQVKTKFISNKINYQN